MEKITYKPIDEKIKEVKLDDNNFMLYQTLKELIHTLNKLTVKL